MKEETVNALQSSLVKILDKTISGVEQGVAFLSSEIPDVIRQLLLWHGVKNAVLFFVLITVSIVSAVMLVKFKNDGVKRWKETIGKSYSDRFDPMLHVLCGIVFFICDGYMLYFFNQTRPCFHANLVSPESMAD